MISKCRSTKVTYDYIHISFHGLCYHVYRPLSYNKTACALLNPDCTSKPADPTSHGPTQVIVMLDCCFSLFIEWNQPVERSSKCVNHTLFSISCFVQLLARGFIQSATTSEDPRSCFSTSRTSTTDGHRIVTWLKKTQKMIIFRPTQPPSHATGPDYFHVH